MGGHERELAHTKVSDVYKIGGGRERLLIDIDPLILSYSCLIRWPCSMSYFQVVYYYWFT